MESGMEGTIIKEAEEFECTWQEEFEDVTNRNDDSIWVSFPVTYIKKDSTGVAALNNLQSKYDLRVKKNAESLEAAKCRLAKKVKEKSLKMGIKMYGVNQLYRMKVRALLLFPFLSKSLLGAIYVNVAHRDIKFGMYLASMVIGLVFDWNTTGVNFDSVLAA